MHGLDADERAMTTAVLGYPRRAIGRYMSPEVLTLRPELSAREALAQVRARAEEAETIYLLPVVDGTRRLLEVSDELVPLQVEARCWCGARANPEAILLLRSSREPTPWRPGPGSGRPW